MKTKEAEGEIETEELPGTKEETPVIVETGTEEKEKVATEKTEPIPEVIPDNLESDEDIQFFKPIDAPAIKETVAEAEKNEDGTEKKPEGILSDDEIFNPEVFKSSENKIETDQQIVEESNTFVTEFLAETKDIFGDKELKTPKDIAAAIKLAIEESKTKVEIDTSKYTGEQLALFNHLQDEKTLAEFADLAEPYISFLSLSDDEKVKRHLEINKGMKSQKDIDEEVDRLVMDDEYDSVVKEINESVIALKDQQIAEKIGKIKADFETVQSNNSKVIASEVQALLKAADEITEFMGRPLTEEFKIKLKEEISSGTLTKVNNNAQTQVKARLYDLVGGPIYQQLVKKSEIERNEAYERGLSKGQGTLHNTKPIMDKPGHLNQPDSAPIGFKDIDKDAISTD